MKWWLSIGKKQLAIIEGRDHLSLGKFIDTHPDVAGVVTDIVSHYECMENLRCNIEWYEGLLKANIVFSPHEVQEKNRIEKKFYRMTHNRAVPFDKFELYLKLKGIIEQEKENPKSIIRKRSIIEICRDTLKDKNFNHVFDSPGKLRKFYYDCNKNEPKIRKQLKTI